MTKKILIIDNAEFEDGDYNQPLLEAVSRITDCEMKNYRDVDEAIINSGQFGGLILSGVPTHYSFGSIDERAQHFAWLRTTSLPVLGICLGHQSMGVIFGSSVLQGTEAEHESTQLQIPEDDLIFNYIDGTKFDVIALHRGSITLPIDFKLLASSSTCQNQVMKHKNKLLYGFQFHPEQSSIGDVLLRNFVEITKAV